MKTATRADVESIEHLDFKPICTGCIPMSGPECSRVATWVTVKRCGHVGFICDTCKSRMKPERAWTCLTCHTHWASASEAIVEMRKL